MCGVATDKEGGEVPMFIGTGNGTPRSTLHKEIVEDLGFKTETVQVPCYTVSNHIPSDIPEVFLFKSDTQGHELYVLRGVEHYLETGGRIHMMFVEFSPFLLQEAGEESSAEALLEWMDKWDYHCKLLRHHDPKKGGVKNPIYGEIDGHRFEHQFGDLICLHKTEPFPVRWT